ncbi:MAG: M23 family metallopeptidase [Gemmatimonadales bacterium]
MLAKAIKALAGGGVLLVLVVWTARVAASSRIPIAAPIVVTKAYVEQADTVRANETLSHVFARHNIAGNDLAAVMRAADGLNPRRILPNQVFRFRYVVGDATPDRIVARLGDERILTISRDSGQVWRGESTEITWSVHLERAEGNISSSLYETLDSSIPDSILPRAERTRLAWDLADGVYGWVIDFYRDIYPGDHFILLFERLTSPMGDVRFGRVVAAKINTRGVENAAYVMTDPNGNNVYYDAAGLSLRRSFKLRPISFARLTSRFSHRRFHPILKRYRPHLGIDYAAALGSPIEATGDGTVIRAGRWGTYGIMVAIRHPKGIETRYAHMRAVARGIKRGVRVKQGQVIGYVGMTGMANAPHVHYEFLKNGQHRDPRAGPQGDPKPVPEQLRVQFESLKLAYDRLLSSTKRTSVD